MDGRATISTEGKWGYVLTLIGLAGTGAVLVWPDQVWQLWIGRALIAVSLLGFVALGLYHIRERLSWKRGGALIALVAGLSLEYWYCSINERARPEPPKQEAANPTPPPAPTTKQPRQVPPFYSSYNRLNIICDKPPKKDENAELKKYIEVMSATVGWKPKFTDIPNGIRIEVYQNIPEIPLVTTEIRRLKDQLYITRIYGFMGAMRDLMDVPIVDPNAAKNGIAIVAEWLNIEPGKCRLI
jgi:hypothetical protein